MKKIILELGIYMEGTMGEKCVSTLMGHVL